MRKQVRRTSRYEIVKADPSGHSMSAGNGQYAVRKVWSDGDRTEWLYGFRTRKSARANAKKFFNCSVFG